MWEKRKGRSGRAEKVFSSMMQGVCVDCGALVVEVGERDPEYIGDNHVRCSKCGWEAQFETSWDE